MSVWFWNTTLVQVQCWFNVYWYWVSEMNGTKQIMWALTENRGLLNLINFYIWNSQIDFLQKAAFAALINVQAPLQLLFSLISSKWKDGVNFHVNWGCFFTNNTHHIHRHADNVFVRPSPPMHAWDWNRSPNHVFACQNIQFQTYYFVNFNMFKSTQPFFRVFQSSSLGGKP